MAQTIKLKRSSVAGNIPGSSDLALGEIAVNTADGALYIKKGDNTIVAVGDNDILHIDTSNGRVGVGTTSPSADLTVSGTIANDAFTIPNSIGSSGQVLKAPSSGTTLTWADESGSSGAIAPSINTMTGDGSTTTLALSTTPVNENATIITFDGVLQHKSTYSLSGSTITFSTAPENGVAVDCIVINTHSIQALEDGDSDTKIQVEETADEDKIRFDTAGTERMIIDSSGNVGIGTTAPEAKLQISHNGGHTSGTVQVSESSFDLFNPLQANTDEKGSLITFSDNYYDGTNYHRTTRAGLKGGTDVVGNNGSGFLSFYTNGGSGNALNETMRLDASGNVGIGTTSPATKLQIVGSTSSAASSGGTLGIRQKGDASTDGITITSSHANSGRIFKDASGHLHIYNTGGSVDDFVIQNTGNVGIGITSPGAKLQVDGAIVSEGGSFSSSTETATDAGLIIQKGDYIYSDDNSYLRKIIGHAGDNNIEIGQGGTVLIGDIILSPGTSGNVVFKTNGSETAKFDSSGNLTLSGTVDGRDIATDGTKLDGIEASADVTDTTNVTAAGALMDSEVTNLAQVKAFDSSDYATAAQGSTADSALQNVVEDTSPQLGGDLASNGNDILFADSDKAIFGAGSDLQIYHDSSNSYIVDSGTGDLNIQATNLSIKNASGGSNYLRATTGGAVNLYHNGNTKLTTTATGIDVTGVITTDGLTTSANINFGDSDKAIFGAGSDLQIYHDGSNSYIKDAGTGSLLIDATNLYLRNSSGEEFASFISDGAANLKYNGSTRIVTTATGIDVTGTITTDSLTSSGAIQGASFSDGTISGITFIDEDSFATNSATRVPTQQSIKAYVDTQVAGVVDSAPAALDTLNELAAALGDDANFSTTTSTALGNRLRVDTAAQGLTGTQQANAITNLGITATKAELNYVDGVTSAIQTQLDGKQASGSYLTGNQTITLSGDVSGSGTTSIAVTIADDSHNHVISNVDGLQAALDGKLSTSGTAANATLFDNMDSTRFLFGSNTSGTNEATVTNWNSPTKTGFYSDDGASNKWSTANWSSIMHIKLYDDNNNYASQLGFDTYQPDLYYRMNNGGTWTSWYEIYHEGHKPTYSELGTMAYSNLTGTPTIPSLSGYATESYVGTQISNLVDSAPSTLDTLNELAAALGDDANFSTTVTNSIATKLPLAGGTMTGDITLGSSTSIKLPNSASDGIRTSTNNRVIDSVDDTLRIGDTAKHNIIRLHAQGSDDFRVYYSATDYQIFHAGNSSQFTSTLLSKLNGIESGATADQTAAEILTAIKTVDGAGSGLDADLLDGISSASFLRSDANDTFTGTLTTGELTIFSEHPVHTGYSGIANTEAWTTTTSQYMIISSGTDTYINGDNVYIRAGNNSSANELKVTTSGTTIGGNTVWHAGNDGAGSGLDADLLDGQSSAYYATAASVTAIAALDPIITLTGAVTGTGTMTNLGNVSITTTATADPTLTLSGDATGSATFTNLGNATLSVTVADDSHNHSSSSGDFTVNGALTATTKSFDIEHPSKKGMRLHHGVLEGPEHSVYVRGKSKEKVILLPDYWVDLVHEDTITIQLTAIGTEQDLYVEDIKDNKVYVNGENYFYYIQAERKDVERFEVEYEI